MKLCPRIIAIGETVVDFVATTQVAHRITRTFEKCFGGAPMNTAICAARLGINVGVITAVGDDPFGHFAIETLRANNVDVAYAKIKKNLRTTLAFVTNLPKTGERSFIFYRRPWCETADSNLVSEDIPTEYARSAEILHVSGFGLSQDPSRSTIFQVVRQAKEVGVQISFDPTLRLEVWNSKDDMRETYSRALRLADIASFSKEETEELLGTSKPRKAVETALDLGITLVGLKRGVDGSILATKDGNFLETKAFKVNAIDTTGAGDAWNAGLLTGLVENWSLQTCALVANAMGALVVTARGAISATPKRSILEAFLRKRKMEPPEFRRSR